MTARGDRGEVHDPLDVAHAYDAFVNTSQAVKMAAIHECFQAAEVKDRWRAIVPPAASRCITSEPMTGRPTSPC